MGIFNIFFKFNTKNDTSRLNNVDLAEQLFNTQMLGADINPKYEKSVEKILKECVEPGQTYPARQNVLLKVINLIGENPKTPKERFIIAKAYAWSRVKYRNKAIFYLNLYLKNELYQEAYTHTHHNFYNTLEDEKKYHLSEMYNYLGKAYERNL